MNVKSMFYVHHIESAVENCKECELQRILKQHVVVSINHIEGNAIIVNKIFLNEMMANSESYFVSTSIGSSQ